MFTTRWNTKTGATMSRYEIPATHEEMRGIVERFGPTAAIIALNQVFTARLDGFITQYAVNDAEDIEVRIAGSDGIYTQKGVSAVTASGTMVHARLHATPHLMDEPAQYLTIIDSIYSDEPAEYWASSSRRVEIGRTSFYDTVIDAHELVGRGPGLRVVEDDEVAFDKQDARLQTALIPWSLPQMTYGHSGWRLRTDLETYEKMHDIFDVRRKITAIHAELGERAVRPLVSEPVDDLQPTGSDE